MKDKKCSLDLKYPTKHEINNILKNLSSSRSTGVDGLDNFSVKIAADVITWPLHHIITLAIMQEISQMDGSLQKSFLCTKKMINFFQKTIDLWPFCPLSARFWKRCSMVRYIVMCQEMVFFITIFMDIEGIGHHLLHCYNYTIDGLKLSVRVR